MISQKEIYNNILYFLEIKDLGEKGYEFLINEKNNFFKPELYKTEISLIRDPALDLNFKSLFIDKPERFSNFLNCVFFYHKNKEISDLNYLEGDFRLIGDIYHLNNLKADIACKGKIKDLIKNKEKINTKDTLLDIEIQINWIENVDNYFDIIKENKNKKIIYLDTLVIAFIIGKNNKSNEIKLIKGKNDSNIELNIFNIVEINFFNEFDLIQNSIKSPLLGYLSKDGQDWIKLISLRSWSKIGKGSYKYIFPKLLLGHKYCSNDYINETILELINGNKLLNKVDLMFENHGNEIRKIERARFKIVKAYLNFYFNKNINVNIFERIYSIEEIEDILKEQIESEMFNEEIMKNFISILVERKISF